MPQSLSNTDYSFYSMVAQKGKKGPDIYIFYRKPLNLIDSFRVTGSR